jgi:hypothetical protein
MLLLPEPQETLAMRTNQNELRREYRRAMRVTIQHIIDQVTLRIADMEEELEKLAEKKGTASKQQMLGAKIEAMQPYTVGVAASNNNALARIADTEPEGLFYAQMDVRSRVAFRQQRWSLDVFMSWHWTFNTSVQNNKASAPTSKANLTFSNSGLLGLEIPRPLLDNKA